MSIIFTKSVSGRKGVCPPQCDVPTKKEIPEEYKRSKEAALCELSELDVIRHFTELSRKNYGVDTNFYPLGSCTMKYNPKVLEKLANLEGFSSLHPVLSQIQCGEKFTQGALAMLYNLEQLLTEITGMDAFTLQPLAGAHGELTAMMLIAAYHKKKGNKKTEVLIPDEAHGTNPSSAAIAGYSVKPIPTNPDTGTLDIEMVKEMVNEQTAALMLTNPNTLGIFNSDIAEIAEIVHQFDAQLYYDGANLNAIMGKFKPGDAHFDAVHLNLHKTFATPHGGGGPGSGPVGVKKHLVDFLPISRIVKSRDDIYSLNYDYPDSIGYIAPFYGNFAVCLKAYAYILLLGSDGLTAVSENAVLNANYTLYSLKDYFDVPYLRNCMHECVLSAKEQLKYGISAFDIAKSLIDRGIHPPTVYFPLIVKDALMIEPTETESKETIDAFVEAMKDIAQIAKTNPEQLHEAPITTPVSRLDETKAAKAMDLIFTPNKKE